MNDPQTGWLSIKGRKRHFFQSAGLAHAPGLFVSACSRYSTSVGVVGLLTQDTRPDADCKVCQKKKAATP